MTFLGDGWMALPVGRSRTLKAPIGTTVSLIPFGSCSGITLLGLRYPLANATMNVGGIGVSNVVRSSPFSVRVRKGNMLLIMLEKHRRSPRKR
jgi:thiamine pyrophosphokinase